MTYVSRTDSSGVNVGGTITYDAVGNPLTYFNGKKNWTFTWKNGRQLETAEITGSGNVIKNTYDNNGRPYKLIVTEGTTKYTGFYILSLRGDVIGIMDLTEDLNNFMHENVETFKAYIGAVSFPKQVLCFGAGINQIGNWGFSYGDLSTFYDDPRDNEMIKWGYELYKGGI